MKKPEEKQIESNMEGEVCKIVTSSYFLSAKDYHENVITRVVFSGINYDEWVRKVKTGL